MMALFLAAPGWGQGKPPSPTLASARQKYLGRKLTIKGPAEATHPGLLAWYINWQVAEQGARDRHHAVSASSWDHLPYRYERHQGTIIAI